MMCALTGHFRKVSSELEEIKEDEVRAWLETTFTQKDSSFKKPQTAAGKFKSAATLVLYGKYMNRWYQEVSLQSHCPPKVARYFKDKIDCWGFDMLHVETLTERSPLRYVAFELFRIHELFKKFEITASCLDNFLVSMENGYHHHNNPYHNSTHASDVVQTLHYFFTNLGITEWFTPLELLAGLLAAVIHDVEHTGTTNNFHIQSNTDLALLYNDRSVLENHHLYYAFSQMKQPDKNILKNLSQDDFRTVRSLVVDMVLATDMSRHFEQIKTLRGVLSHQDSTVVPSLDRSKVLCLMLHCADISHPAKPWEVHKEWTLRLINEFFRQGDMEKELGRQCSPLCDRNTTLIPESQIGFIDIIVSPSFELFSDIVEVTRMSCDSVPASPVNWGSILQQNKQKWKDQCKGGSDSDVGSGDQAGHVKTVECLTTSVVKERKLSRVETSKDGSAKVIETVHRTQEERRIEIEH